MATGTRRSGSPSAGDEGLRREATACCPSRVTRWQSNVLRFKSSHHRGLYHANDSSRLIIPGTHDSPMYQFNFSFTFGNLFWFLRGPHEALTVLCPPQWVLCGHCLGCLFSSHPPNVSPPVLSADSGILCAVSSNAISYPKFCQLMFFLLASWTSLKNIKSACVSVLN